MDQSAHPLTIDTLLARFEGLIAQERDALTRLDSRSVEQCSSAKADLEQALRERSAELEAAHRARLQGIASGLKQNQVLLVHARDQVLGTIALLSGSPTSMGANRKLPSGAVRLSTRG